MESSQKTILFVEDDPALRDVYQGCLSEAGLRVVAADLVGVAWSLFTREKPDLALVDWNLPDGSGLDLCQRIRDHKELARTPVIMLTSRAGFEDKAAGFKAGADQYLVKPVAADELLLWVEALLRRITYEREDGDVLKAGDCELDLKSHIVRYKGQVIPYLTVKEYELRYFLVKKRPQVLSRKHILSKLWHTIAVDHVVDTHLTNLRKKLPRELADKIQAVTGKGFRYFE